MQIKIYAIYDQKVAGYAPPFFMRNDAVASRAMASVLQDPTTDISKHPADYSLHCLGTFDDTSGEITGIQPAFIAIASQLLVEPPEPKEIFAHIKEA